MLSNRVVVTLLAAANLLFVSSPAYAYLDPGTGSMLLQGLIAAVAGGLVAIRHYWTRIQSLLGVKKGSRKSTSVDDLEP